MMNIILADKTKIEADGIRPDGRGLIIDVAAGQLSEIEPLITNDNIDTIVCVEDNTIFARYCNQQLESISKDDTGIHIKTRYKTINAGVDVSKQLASLQNTILQMKNDITSVRDVQDVQNVAIAEIGGIVSQNMLSSENGEEATGDDTILCDDDKDKESNT